MAFGLEFETRIAGFDELEKAFNQLPNAMSKSVLRSALKKSLKPVLATAKRLVRHLSGDLERSLVIGTKLKSTQKSDKRPGAVGVFLGAEWPEGAHAHLLEFGTSRARMFPFLRPAWDEHKDGIPKEVGNEIWRRLRMLAKRLHKQALAGKLSKAGRKALG